MAYSRHQANASVSFVRTLQLGCPRSFRNGAMDQWTTNYCKGLNLTEGNGGTVTTNSCAGSTSYRQVRPCRLVRPGPCFPFETWTNQRKDAETSCWNFCYQPAGTATVVTRSNSCFLAFLAAGCPVGRIDWTNRARWTERYTALTGAAYRGIARTT